MLKRVIFASIIPPFLYYTKDMKTSLFHALSIAMHPLKTASAEHLRIIKNAPQCVFYLFLRAQAAEQPQNERNYHRDDRRQRHPLQVERAEVQHRAGEAGNERDRG